MSISLRKFRIYEKSILIKYGGFYYTGRSISKRTNYYCYSLLTDVFTLIFFFLYFNFRRNPTLPEYIHSVGRRGFVFLWRIIPGAGYVGTTFSHFL